MKNFMMDYEIKEDVIINKEGIQITNGIFKVTSYKRIKFRTDEMYMAIVKFTILLNK